MQQLFEIATSGTKSNQIFKLTNVLLKDIAKLNSLINDLKAEKKTQVEQFEIENINKALQSIANKIISLNYLNSSRDNPAVVPNLTREIESELSLISIKLS